MVRNQHFIPKCVLKYFKESDNVNNKKERRIYHVLHSHGSAFITIIDSAMARDFYYEVDDFKRNTIEKILEKFETYFSKKLGVLVKTISDYENGCVKYSVVKSKCYQLLKDMIKMHLRSGALVYELGFWVRKAKQRHRIYGMLNRFLNSRYIEEFSRALTEHHEFCLLKCETNEFLISDQYMCTAALSFKAQFSNATNRSLGQRDVIILFPITKSYYMCFYHGNKPRYIHRDRLVKLKKSEVEEINKVIINNSYMETAGPKLESLENSLVKYIDSTPFGIYYGGDGFSGGSEMRKEVFFYDSDLKIYEFIRLPHKWREFWDLEKND